MKTQAERDTQDCIVIMAPCCGRVIMATVNDEHMDAGTRNEIASAVQRKYRVEHKTADEVRKLPFGCRCGRAL